MSEAWNDYYTDAEIKSIQAIELQSLEVLDEICKKLGIRYFLYGGSLLGAVKYQGFVPWDDDLDLSMLRADYERFIEEASALLPPQYEVQHPRLTPKSPYNYIKFRRTDTALAEYQNHKLKINHGVYFDIYPIDNIPDDYADYMKQKLQYDKWVAVFQVRQNFRIDHKIASAKDFVWATIRFVQSVVAHVFSVRFLINRIDEISTRYNGVTTKNQGNLTFPKLSNYFNGIEPVEVQFEGRTLWIPKGYAVNLKNRYGDINRLPPVENRVGHKAYILDLGDSNRED